MKKLIAMLAIGLASCAHSGNKFDYHVSGEKVQKVSLAGVREVIVKCHCPLHTIKEDSTDGAILRIKGSQSAVGYHGGGGEPNNPTEVSEELLDFIERRDGEILTLESREQTYIHHARILSEVHLSVPVGLAVKFIEIPYQELEAREVN